MGECWVEGAFAGDFVVGEFWGRGFFFFFDGFGLASGFSGVVVVVVFVLVVCDIIVAKA